MQDVPRLLEVLDGLLLGAALSERECEAVQRQRFSLLVPEVADDLERDPVLLGRVDRVALAAKLRSELVELHRAATAADRVQPVDGSGVGLECACEELGASPGCSGHPYPGMGPQPLHAPPARRAEPPRALPDPKPAKLSTASRGRVRRGHETMCDRFAGLEMSRREAPPDSEQEEEERSEGDEGDDHERKHEQEPTQQQPQAGEREQARAEAFPIFRHRRARSLGMRSSFGAAAISPCSGRILPPSPSN
jgi:hypothetical protein